MADDSKKRGRLERFVQGAHGLLDIKKGIDEVRDALKSDDKEKND